MICLLILLKYLYCKFNNYNPGLKVPGEPYGKL